MDSCEELEEILSDNPVSEKSIEENIEIEIPNGETDDNDIEEDIIDKEQIIANISDKSEMIINDIADNLEIPEDIDMFQEDNSENIQEKSPVSEEVPEEDLIDIEEPADKEESDNDEENNYQPEDYSYSTITHENMLDELNKSSSEDTIPEYEIPAENIAEDYSQEIEINTNDDKEEISEINNTEDSDEGESIIIDTDEIGDISDSIEIDDLSDEGIIEESQLKTENLEDSNLQDIVYEDNNRDNYSDVENLSENTGDEIVELKEDNYNPEEEFVELDSSETNDDDILVEIDSENFEEELDEQIKRDVDQVYTTIKDNEVSESDLDFIDEIKGEEQDLSEGLSTDIELDDDNEISGDVLEEYHSDEQADSIIENEILEKRDSSTPIVPVYDAEIPQEDVVMSDPVEQGDSVSHVKYGHGIVEKLVKYGSKTLYMINFEMDGRKLLDPLLTEIKKN